MNNNSNLLTIGDAAKILGVSIDTLRRWDKNGSLKSIRQSRGKYLYRYYRESDLNEYLLNLDIYKEAKDWAKSSVPLEPQSTFYCANISVFNARLSRLEFELQKIIELNKTFSLITACAGEIGSNSFEHNIGNWPDIPGIFFAYNTEQRKIVLADRGQGIKKTLGRVRANLKDHKQALRIAFSEILSGRSQESRGNGLKYVRKRIIENPFKLIFQGGNALLRLKQGDKNLNIRITKSFAQGCIALIKF